MNKNELIGTWKIFELIHMFSDDLGRIPVSDYKSNDGTPTFADLRFVFCDDGKYRVYSTPDCSELKHEGAFWQDEKGDLRHDPIGKEAINPIVLEDMQLLRFDSDELNMNIPFMSLFLKKID